MRQTFQKFLIASFGILGVMSAAHAQTDLYVRGSGKMFPVALPQLCLRSGDGSVAKEIPTVMGRDLDLSGYFDVLNPKAFLETPGKCNTVEGVAYSDWSVIGAEGLVKGNVDVSPDGRVRVQLYLHDVQKQGVVLGKEYDGDLSQVPSMAHRFANEIMKFFTGEYGVFGTQIAFSSKVGRFKELFVMDMDGSNIRQLTNDRSLSLSSSWDPSGTRLVFTSYRSRVPDLFVMDVASRATRQVTRGGELEIGNRFAPNGNQILTSRTEPRGGSSLVLLNLDGSLAGQLSGGGRTIDVSPFYSPDGSEIVFCSNRGGGPQIYRMSAAGGGARRVSFVSSNYCTSPAWSPKGDKIAFVCRADGGFNLFVADPDGGNPQQLTAGGSSEDPEFSPDGRHIVFSTTTFGGPPSLALIRSDGKSIKRITTSRGGDFEPTWGPMLR
jgi:TolB protein